jgi:hypothetical protein
MNIFSLFNPKWFGVQMTEADRQMMFYYLKRKTSLTAWRRKADAFDKFVTVLEKQVREEPIRKATETEVFDTHWEGKYRKALKAQVHFEKALEHLARGDRTVWRWNEQGHFADACIYSHSLHSTLVNNGVHGDQFPKGKYLNEMVDALRAFALASQPLADVIQPQIQDTPAAYWWNPLARKKFQKISFPDPLPPVPDPPPAPLYYTGEIVPVFGIYEPQVEDGCMNYLLGDVEAPGIWHDHGKLGLSGPHKVSWRLIWEDTRYQDGTVPEIEQHYFPEDPVIEHVDRKNFRSETVIHAESNTVCPRDGEWVALYNLTARIEMKTGEVMPLCEGRNMTWVWVKKN